MHDPAKLLSKVLVLEHDADSLAGLRAFCDDNGLVGLKPQGDSALAVLRSNVDLGGVFLAEDFTAAEAKGLALAHAIHAARPELPIFLRRTTNHELPDHDRRVLRTTYSTPNTQADAATLRTAVSESIFSQVYPNALVRGIAEISMQALSALFPRCTLATESPYVVHDRIIFGSLFTLIPLESHWCRGYMMLQAEEASVRGLMETDGQGRDADFRELNNLLGETTNLIWGGFKNRFIDYRDIGGHLTQVPIVINHEQRYISFGSQDPQLCFRYVLTDARSAGAPATVLLQRFIFNLNWSPDDFHENTASVESLCESGELEMF